MSGIHLSREELYEKVWSTPLRTLAPDLGISDRGLAKTCVRLEIPLPGRGYWRRVELGQQVEKEELPPASDTCQKRAHFHGPHEKPEPIVIPEAGIVDKAKAFEARASNRIVVPEKIQRYNPLVKKTLESLMEQSHWSNHQGLYKSNTEYTLDLTCTKECAPRAAKIYHVLLQALKERGYEVSVSASSYSHETRVSCYGETIKISMREKLMRAPYKPPKGRTPSSFDPKVTYVPSGKLALRIDEYSSDSREHCVDGDNGPLEEQLNDFMIRLAKAAIHLKWKRAEWEERERRWAAEKAYQENIRQQAVLEQTRREELDGFVLDWIKSKQIREFIEAIRFSPLYLPYDDMNKEEWLTWASNYADELDPLHVDDI